MNYMGSQGICYKHRRNHPGGCHHPKNGYVKDQISFKLLLLTFKALHGLAPIYISELTLNHIIRHVPSVQVHLTISLFLSLTLQPTGTDVSLLPLQKCGTPYLAISVTLKTCALLKLVLKHGFLNPHLI